MAFCVLVEKELVVNICPLNERHCVYRHRSTHECKSLEGQYAKSVEELAQIVGSEIPSVSEQQRIKQNLATAIKGILNEES